MTTTALGGLARFGFDPGRAAYALRTALTACLGLLVAWMLGLEHPQWTAMTVWAASQPIRGMLLEKSLFRAAGTVLGVAVGVLLMWLANGETIILVLGLSLWIGLCAGLGNVLRGFLSYGAILAGYSAAMVALLDVAHPGHLMGLGIDRLLTVLVGVGIGALAGLLFTPVEAEEVLVGQIRRLSAQLLRLMARRLAGHADATDSEQDIMLAELAAIDDALDRHGAGSLRSRRAMKRLRAVVAAQVSALIWLRRGEPAATDPAIAAALARVADSLEVSTRAEDALPELRTVLALSQDRPALHDVATQLDTALRGGLSPDGTPSGRPARHSPLVLHRDWVGAWQAALRATGTLLLAGLAWVLTGWSAGAFVMLGISVMLTLFSTMENPAHIMRFVFIGQLIGALGALACRWLVWPAATDQLQLILMMMPFMLLGAPLLAHRRTMAIAFDYNMVLPLLLQPSFPLSGNLAGSLAIAGAVVLAPLIAFGAFRHVFPADAARRMDTLIAMMIHELQDMASNTAAPSRRHVWRARLQHRLLRLLRWAERGGAGLLPALDGSVAVVRLGGTILLIHDLLHRADLTPGTRRVLAAAQARLRRLGRAPDSAARALELAARRLQRDAPDAAAAARDAAEALVANRTFLQRGMAARPDAGPRRMTRSQTVATPP